MVNRSIHLPPLRSFKCPPHTQQCRPSQVNKRVTSVPAQWQCGVNQHWQWHNSQTVNIERSHPQILPKVLWLTAINFTENSKYTIIAFFGTNHFIIFQSTVTLAEVKATRAFIFLAGVSLLGTARGFPILNMANIWLHMYSGISISVQARKSSPRPLLASPWGTVVEHCPLWVGSVLPSDI